MSVSLSFIKQNLARVLKKRKKNLTSVHFGLMIRGNYG